MQSRGCSTGEFAQLCASELRHEHCPDESRFALQAVGLSDAGRFRMTSHLGEHAVVIGGSIAGLMSARVLADYFDSVTVLERDQIDSAPAVHKSIPQGNHVHGIWPSGMGVMTSLYPGFLAKLEQLGSIGSRLGKEVAVYFPDSKAYSLSGTVREPRDLGIDFYQQSRGLLEHCVRQSTLECPNVDFQANCSVDALICRNGGVTGARCGRDGDATTIKADLVIDTGGRGSRVTRWLARMGFRVVGGDHDWRGHGLLQREVPRAG
jgi:2-polyprenyl-6-methoxyphenol hydroxylase-like FAD-dependent oxidoreductase